MNETPMLFPITPDEFWKKMKEIVDAVLAQRLPNAKPLSSAPEKVLLKATDVCTLFSVSKPTLYQWLKDNRLKSFKINSRRYFLKSDIESLITGKEVSNQLSHITSKF